VIHAAEERAQVAAETKYLLESCVRENHRREIEHAKGMGFEAWRRVLNIALSRWFDRLPTESRESILFDILQEIPPVIRKPLLSVPTAAILSETIVMLITKLREDHQSSFQLVAANTLGGLPVDRLHGLLKSLLASLLTVGMSEVVRGNLYVALINEFQLGKAHEEESPADEPVEEEDDFGLDPTLFGNSSAFSRGLVRYSGFEIGTIDIIAGVADRLVPLVCRDAIDGSEVWKSAAFTLLDSLVRLSRLHRQHKILNVLARQGYLQNFVSGLKEADEDLQMVLKPDPGSYFFFLIVASVLAYSSHRESQCLIRSRSEDVVFDPSSADASRCGEVGHRPLFSVLAQCEYIDSRPQADQAFVGPCSLLIHITRI
jgi:nuclear pore complex protein Nup205